MNVQGIRDEHLLDLLKDIISSSDANCEGSLANAICAAKDAVYGGRQMNEEQERSVMISGSTFGLTDTEIMELLKSRGVEASIVESIELFLSFHHDGERLMDVDLDEMIEEYGSWHDRDWHEPEDAGTDTAYVRSRALSDDEVKRLSKAERDKIIRKAEAWCTEQEKNGTHAFAAEYILLVGNDAKWD